MEIVIMKDGFPAQVKPNEDHVTRIHVLMSWLQKQTMMGVPIDPMVQRRVQEHLAVHFQFLQKMQPQAAKELIMQVRQMETQPGGPGGGGPPGPGGPPPGSGPPPQGGPIPGQEPNPATNL